MRKEIAVLTNPTSGKGKGGRIGEVVVPRLADAGYAVRALVGRDADEAQDLARQAVADGIETLVVIGGDGMVHLAVQALAGSATRLGVVPAGTGNDVARTLGLPRKDPAAATDVVIGGHERTIDLARIGHRYYVTVLAAGFDAIVNERANRMRWPRGPRRYDVAIFLEMVRVRPRLYALEIDGVDHGFEGTLVAVGNCASYGGGLRIVPDADPTDGLLDVLTALPLSRRAMTRLKPRLRRGTHVTDPRVRTFRAKQVRLHSNGIIAYADGERIGPLPLEITCVPGALRLLR